MRITILMALCGATLAQADTPMSGPDFAAYTNGKTLSFSSGGRLFGGEQYLSGNRVFWSNLDGNCISGEWTSVGDQICFAYEALTEPQCWHFFLEPSGLRALYLNDDTNFNLFEEDQTTEPLYCKGPEIGV